MVRSVLAVVRSQGLGFLLYMLLKSFVVFYFAGSLIAFLELLVNAMLAIRGTPQRTSGTFWRHPLTPRTPTEDASGTLWRHTPTHCSSL